ncbi:MAG: YibE/F family protein [Streptococcaceae bacterium]|nr:YibE/F family protein [Streptococcaceae bacterium]
MRWGVKIGLVVLAALVVGFFVQKETFFYHTPVAKIVSVSNQQSVVTDDYGNQDTQVVQRLSLQMLNGNKEHLTLSNTANRSQATGQVYENGQLVLLSGANAGAQIVSLKRDGVIVGLVVLFVGLLGLFLGRRASLFVGLSLLLNLLYFVVVVAFTLSGVLPVLVLFAVLAVVFAASSLVFVLGLTRQALDSFVSTLVTTALTFGLTLLVLALTGNNGVHFEFANYVTENPEVFFFVGALISVLGAIMDGVCDIVAGLYAMARQGGASQAQYFKSGLAIGREITGTLTNVLFMIFLAETMPMALLLLKNGNDWSYIATIAMNLGLLQTLIAAIGIVLAVPVTAFWVSRRLGRLAADDLNKLQVSGLEKEGLDE